MIFQKKTKITKTKNWKIWRKARYPISRWSQSYLSIKLQQLRLCCCFFLARMRIFLCSSQRMPVCIKISLISLKPKAMERLAPFRGGSVFRNWAYLHISFSFWYYNHLLTPWPVSYMLRVVKIYCGQLHSLSCDALPTLQPNWSRSDLMHFQIIIRMITCWYKFSSEYPTTPPPPHAS